MYMVALINNIFVRIKRLQSAVIFTHTYAFRRDTIARLSG